MKEKFTICPGCGVRLPRRDVLPDRRVNASAECWEKYGELAAYTLSLEDPDFPHQLVVDSYAAQHIGVMSRPIGISFALIGLCLVNEWGYTGRQVQKAHMLLANRNRNWLKFEPPPMKGTLSAADVLDAPPGKKRGGMIAKWSESVWKNWAKEHKNIIQLIRMYFNPGKARGNIVL